MDRKGNEMKKSGKDLFNEVKIKMVMRLNNMTRRQAVADIAKRGRTSTNASKCDSDDDLLSAEEFFAGE